MTRRISSSRPMTGSSRPLDRKTDPTLGGVHLDHFGPCRLVRLEYLCRILDPLVGDLRDVDQPLDCQGTISANAPKVGELEDLDLGDLADGVLVGDPIPRVGADSCLMPKLIFGFSPVLSMLSTLALTSSPFSKISEG